MPQSANWWNDGSIHGTVEFQFSWQTLVDVRQAVGLLRDDRGLDRKPLSVGALKLGFEDAEHRIANFRIIDAHRCRGDEAGKIPTEHQGKRGLRILAAARFPIGAVDTRRYYIDDDLFRCRHGVWAKSPYFKTSGPPNCSMKAAFIICRLFSATRIVPRLTEA